MGALADATGLADETLEEQGVTHNVKALVLELKQSEEDMRRCLQLQEEEHNEAELKEKRIQRTKRGLEILAERGTHLWLQLVPGPQGVGVRHASQWSHLHSAPLSVALPP